MKIICYKAFFLICIIFSDLIVAKEKVNILYIRHSPPINYKIKKVYSWGLKDSLNRSVRYRVLDSLKTSEKNALNEITNIIKGLKIVNRDTYYFCDFENAIIPLYKGKKDSFFQKSILLNISSENSARYGFQYNYSTHYIIILLHSVGYSLNIYSGKPRFIVSTIKYGIGKEYDWKNYRMLLLINYARKILLARYSNNSGYNKYKNTIFFSSYLQYIIDKSRKYMITLGLNYYLSNIEIKNSTTKFSINIGIGINLKR